MSVYKIVIGKNMARQNKNTSHLFTSQKSIKKVNTQKLVQNKKWDLFGVFVQKLHL